LIACYDESLRPFHQSAPARTLAALTAGLAVVCLLPVRTRSQGAHAYTIITVTGRQALPTRSVRGVDILQIEDIAPLFHLTLHEDSLGLTIVTPGERILLVPGQSFASIAGRVVSLSRPVERDRSGWQVPLDFLSNALGPATNTRIDVRPASRLVVIGKARVPQITGRYTALASGGQLMLDILPDTPHRVSRDGRHLVIHFDADALDAAPIPGLSPEFATAVRVDGSSLVVDLGREAVSYTIADDRSQSRLTVDLLPAPPPPPPPPPPAAAALGEPPAATATSPGAAPVWSPPMPTVGAPQSSGLQTIVIDPGHGGDDQGARGQKGAQEKDITLDVARRLKTAIETRLGLRVLLTRDGDIDVPIDRRTAFANNNKAGLFISLHANASFRPSARGAQVLTLSLDEYQTREEAVTRPGLPVPVLGGGTRPIEPVAWELAQMPFADQSATVGAILVKQLSDHGVPLYSQPTNRMPLRVLVGANMPAVLVEMGFLTNASDERALTGSAEPGAIVEAILGTIDDIRNGIPTPTRHGGQ
jgi:N-acetylmuramoyl-L-alanine amidase